MKVLMINGSPEEHGCTYTALSEVGMTLEKHGIQTRIHWIGTKPVQGCVNCGKCAETGKCAFNDQVNDAAELLDQSDALVVGSPVYYGSASGQVTALLDRLFFSACDRFAGKPAAAVVSCRRGGATATFDQLNKYFALCNMPIVTSQYWNQVHGFTPEDVRQDIEGLQTMRTLGENMAWLLKCIEAGKAAGIPAPGYEDVIMTNFVR